MAECDITICDNGLNCTTVNKVFESWKWITFIWGEGVIEGGVLGPPWGGGSCIFFPCVTKFLHVL